jgi:DNA-binding NtrC family response regulator
MRPRIRIVSPDAAFADALGRRLCGWGLQVVLERDLAAIAPGEASGERVDVLLLDVRRREDGLVGRLAALKEASPALEVILLTLPGQVAISIAGMRAGASSELSAPFDLAALRGALSAALRRRNQRLPAPRPSLRERFERAMSAATFAQAGELETAREILAEGAGARADPAEEDGERRAPPRKQEGT